MLASAIRRHTSGCACFKNVFLRSPGCVCSIIDFVASPPIRRLLIEEAERGLPPVGAISERFLRKFGHDSESRAQIRSTPVKQFVGMCVRAVLEEAGYRVAEKGVRVYDEEKLFSVGSVYEPVGAEPALPGTSTKGHADLAEAMFARLSDAEALRALRLLEKTHPQLLKKGSILVRKE
jgi:hypothetical protein